MKPKPSPFLCLAKYSAGIPSCASICAALAFSFLYVSSVRAETRVWDGGATVSGTNGTGVNMGTASNWGVPGNPGANALPVSGDTLEFSGFDTTTTDLNMNAAFFASPGAFAAINVDQSNPLTFAAITNTSYLRMAPGSNFTVTNGAVTFNAGRIVFGVGTTGTTESFTLTNNSASPVTWGPNAATPIAVGTGPAGGGGRNMTFAGSGNWVFNSKFDGGIMAVVTKTGAGSLTLNATGNALANIATTPLTISQGSIVFDGAANLNSGTYASPIANSAALVYSSSANQTFSGPITGTGSLEKNTGASTLTLAGVNNYSGATTLTSGTLAFTGDSSIGSLSVADFTTLAVKLTGPSVSPLKPSSLTLGVTPTEYSNLSVDFAGSVNPTVPVINLGAGSLALNQQVDVALSGLTGLTTSTNTVKLLNYSSLTGAGSFNLLTTASGHSSFELHQTSTALYLNVTAMVNIWKGTTDNIWDSGTLNWSLPDGYLDGDTVIFNDTAGITSVNIAYTVSPGAVTFSNSSAKTYTLTSDTGSGIGGTAPLILNGTNGTVVVTNTNTYTGTTTIGAGNTLRLGDGTIDGSISSTSDIINNGSLVYNRVGTAFTYNGVISGSGSILKEGSGTQLLGATNTYSGGTTLNGGDLQIQNGNAFGTGSLTLATGSLTARITSRIVPNPVTMTGDFTLNSSTAGGNLLTLSGNVDLMGTTRTITVANTGGSAITGVVSNGGITKAGTGTLTLAGINTYTGPTLISEGRLQIGNGVLDGNIDSTSSIVNNGTLAYNFAGPHTISMPISGTGALVKAGAGTLTLSGTNTYAGTTTITGGILVAQNSSSLGSGGLVSIVNRNGGLQLTGGITLSNNFVTSNDGTVNNGYAIANASGNNTISGTISLIDGGGDTIIQSDSGSLTLSGAVSNGYTATRGLILRGASTGANTVSGVISDGATAVTNVTKREAGNWSLTGANTYTGTTTVEGGTLKLTLPNLADTAAVVIATGAVLNLDYTGTDQIALLTVAGTALPNGLYTKDSPETAGFITGAGKIQVGAVAGGYASWAEANAPGQTKDQDHDNDGVDNGIEYFMGATGSSVTANPGLSGGTVTWTKGASYAGTYGSDFVIQSSIDLVSWSPLPEVGSGVVNSAGSVSYTPPTGQPKHFTRLVVNN